MMILRWALVFALSCAVAPAWAAPTEGIDAARLSRHVRIVSSDAYEGRGPATRAETKTIAYMVSQFKAEGLQPGGDPMGPGGKRAWTQAVPLARFAISGPVKASFTSDGRVQPLTQGDEVSLRPAETNVDRVRTRRSSSPATALLRPSANGTISRAWICTARWCWCWSTIPTSRRERAISAERL
jgi:hypothetical protein